MTHVTPHSTTFTMLENAQISHIHSSRHEGDYRVTQINNSSSDIFIPLALQLRLGALRQM